MTLGDGFEIGGKHTYRDFGQVVASRNIGAPQKKTSYKTVPYMNGFYDFSAVSGSAAFEAREVEYSFDIIGQDRQDVQRQYSELASWLAPMTDVDIHDDDMPDRHLKGSCDSVSWEEGESGESGTLAVVFKCHPFIVKNEAKRALLKNGQNTVVNDGMPVNPTIHPVGTVTVEIGGIKQKVSSSQRLVMRLESGENTVTLSGESATLEWNEEVI